MKVVKIILIVILAIVATVIAIGLIVPNFEYGNSIAVQAPAEKCWKVFHDTSRMNHWMEGFKSIVLTKGDHLQPGSEYRIVIVDGNERMEMSEKIIAVNAPESVSYELNNDVLRSEFTYRFKGDDNTTEIITNYKVTGNNVFMRAFLFFMKAYLKDSEKKMLEGLKREIESQPNGS